MTRSAKPSTAPAGPHTAAVVCEEIEGEFLGISIILGRMREQLLALARRADARPQRD
jgi:hypothetical protein